MNIEKPVKHKDLNVGTFVLCEFAGKKSKSYFVGVITKPEDDDGDFEINFYRKLSKE